MSWAEAFMYVMLSLIPSSAVVAIVWIQHRSRNVSK